MIKHLMKVDFLFQYRQKIIAIYLIVTLFYLLILSFVPTNYLKFVVPAIIFSDPAGIGLFFIGGVLMSEETQGINHFLSIIPLSIREILFSKIVTFSITSTIVGLIIGVFSFKIDANYFFLTIGLLLTSFLFSMVGIFISTKSKTLNDYFIKVIPPMLLLIFPVFSIIFSFNHYLAFIPSVAGFNLIYYSFNEGSYNLLIVETIYLCLVNYFLFKKLVTYKEVSK
jgi:fluoroquinolone transport system permease protein